jgi:flagellar biosynthesis/type III secretory pathway protein FliH
MSQQSHEKFMFGTSFAPEDISYRQNFHSPEDLEAAKAASYAQGFQAAQSDFEALNQAQLQMLVTQVEQLFLQQEMMTQNLHHHVAILAQKALTAAFPIYAKKGGGEEIWEALSQVLAQEKSLKAFTVYVAPASEESLSQKLATLKKKDITVSVQVQEDMGPSDCRIEWDSSGLERVEKNLLQELLQVLERMDACPTLALDLTQNISEPQPQGDFE